MCNESLGGLGECYCTGTLSTEDEIRMLEAMKNQEKIQLNEIDRKIDELRKTVRE